MTRQAQTPQPQRLAQSPQTRDGPYGAAYRYPAEVQAFHMAAYVTPKPQ